MSHLVQILYTHILVTYAKNQKLIFRLKFCLWAIKSCLDIFFLHFFLIFCPVTWKVSDYIRYNLYMLSLSLENLKSVALILKSH